MVKRKNKKEQILIKYEDWTNKKTGEVRTFLVVSREKKKGKESWYNLLPDFLNITGTIGKKKMKVLEYILNSISEYDNTFGGTVREIAKECNVSINTVQDVLNVLTNENLFLKRVRSGQYVVNLEILKRHDNTGIIINYI